MKKDTIYIDADDEISAIADKVVTSKAKVVALVLPKRCTMLHSAVNMKILNKAAKTAGRQIVLITNEKALIPIAAASSVYVAKNLTSKPAIPTLGQPIEPPTEESANIDESEPELDPQKPIGELAGDEPITIKEEEKPDTGDDKPKPKEKPKNKKLKVPNFDSFRAKLFLGIGILILLAIGWYFAYFVMPKAEITIKSQTQEIPVTVEITASADIKSDDIDKKEFELQSKSIEKSSTQSGNATGSKNIGQKAGGKVTITNCESTSSITVPSGTTLTASGPSGLKYVTTESVGVPGSGAGPGFVCDESGKADVNVQAVEPGGVYNVSERQYKISGGLGNLYAYGGAMSGGTDQEVKIVEQADCDSLKSGLEANSSSEDVKKQLIADFEKEGLSASLDSYKVELISSGCEPAVGQQADTVTAKATYQYTLSGVSSESLGELINKQAQEQAGENQTIVDTGLSKAVISIDGNNSGDLELTVKTTAKTGVKQDEQPIKEQIKGKNARETADYIKSINGVQDVKVDYKPFWVNKTPKNTNKINLNFETEN